VRLNPENSVKTESRDKTKKMVSGRAMVGMLRLSEHSVNDVCVCVCVRERERCL
jgi:hypothetical protein